MDCSLYITFRIYWILFLISKVSALNDSNSTDQNNTFVCIREYEFDNMDIREILGQWKVMELYMHIKREGVNQYPTCPQVTIWETDDFPRTTFGPSTDNQLYHVHINTKFKRNYRHLRLLWNEAGETSEYALYFRNDSTGYWHVVGGQNGTLPSRKNYKQFSGTIQVLIAINDHLVLNFCQEPTDGRQAQFYSVLLSREPDLMAAWEVDSIRNMLQHKKLSVASRRIVCQNNAGKLFTNVIFSMCSCFIFYVISIL